MPTRAASSSRGGGAGTSGTISAVNRTRSKTGPLPSSFKQSSSSSSAAAGGGSRRGSVTKDSRDSSRAKTKAAVSGGRRPPVMRDEEEEEHEEEEEEVEEEEWDVEAIAMEEEEYDAEDEAYERALAFEEMLASLPPPPPLAGSGGSGGGGGVTTSAPSRKSGIGGASSSSSSGAAPSTPRMATRRSSTSTSASFQPAMLVDKANPWVKAKQAQKEASLASFLPSPYLGFPLFIVISSLAFTLLDALRLGVFPQRLITYHHPARTYFSFLPHMQPSSESMLSFGRLTSAISALCYALFHNKDWTAASTHLRDCAMVAALNSMIFAASFVAASLFRHWPGVLNGAFMAAWCLQLYLTERFWSFRGHNKGSGMIRLILFSIVAAAVAQLTEGYSISSGFYHFSHAEDRHAGPGYPLWLSPLAMAGAMAVASIMPLIRAGGDHNHHHHHQHQHAHHH